MIREEMIEQESLKIPRSLFQTLQKAKESGSQKDIDNAVEQILMSQMFQMLNDYPIPPKYCRHLRQIVFPDDTGYKAYQCLNCKVYL